MAEKPDPVKVLYCPTCSLPAEYCEFGSDFEKCKPWLIKNAPELYPDLLKGMNFYLFFCFNLENPEDLCLFPAVMTDFKTQRIDLFIWVGRG